VPVEAEQARQRVAEHRVAEVTDVRRLVGVDGRVLDDGLHTGDGTARCAALAEVCAQEGGPVEEDVHVAVGRRLDASHALDGPTAAATSCAMARGGLPQAPGQLEGERQREVAHRAVGWHFEGQRWRVFGGNPEERLEDPGDAGANGVVNRQNHEISGG
jgi:hypothetical protein